MEIRTFGWIQNPSDLNKLKLTVNTIVILNIIKNY